MKHIAVISWDPLAGRFYGKQVKDLFADLVDVQVYSVRDGSINQLHRRYDLYMTSTDAFESGSDLRQYLPLDAEITEIELTFLWDVVRRLQKLPAGSRVLFVNLSDKMSREAVSRLNQLGVNQLQFDLYHPGCPLPDMDRYDFVITPSEQRYIPPGAREVIDIGQRVCTSATMTEAALKLGLEDLLETPRFQHYQEIVATNTYSFDRLFNRSRRLESQFDILMDILDEGLVGVNEKGEVFACNKKMEQISQVSNSLALHRRASEVYPFIPFTQCLKSKQAIPAKVVRAGGTNLTVTVAPVLRSGVCLGAFATVQRFSDAEQRQNELRSQLSPKGYRAKYTFADVIGSSPAIRRTIEILKKMAATPLPVLLIGETGTGKELFAHAVHNASPRAQGPFVAINCAAMPENLLESELFGYEDGAFTGARKGGKPGLFEFAHQGTLFLDEVEGMSPALQCKLLRVLQEHEIMPVGGNRIIRVDVRIVAATNEDLEQRVEDGSFRRDLYYRLNTLPALIPPLRQREGDLLLLIEYFRKKSGVEFTISPELKRLLLTHQWRGNIRELRNVVEYFSYTGSRIVTPSDLPPTFHYLAVEASDTAQSSPLGVATVAPANASVAGSPPSGLTGAQWLLLRLIYQAARQGHSAGRDTLLAAARQIGHPLSQQQVRRLMSELSQAGYLRIERGRGGSHLTEEGLKLLHLSQNDQL